MLLTNKTALSTTAVFFLTVSITIANAGNAGPFLPSQCADYKALNFDIFQYSEYDRYFDEESTLTLAQTGTYQGPNGIEEYVSFTDNNSPYIDDESRFFAESDLSGFDTNTGMCKFSIYTLQTATLNDDITEGGTLSYGALQHVYYSIPARKVTTVDIYYSPEFIGEFFRRLKTSPGSMATCRKRNVFGSYCSYPRRKVRNSCYCYCFIESTST